MNKKLIVGILVGGALGATVAYYRHRIMERFVLVPVDSPRDHEAEEYFSEEEEARG
jgi:CRISPR/Cas system-associated protein Csm6